MAAVKQIRDRIRSIKNTAKITKAMELVSAAKMRRAQEAAESGKPYSILINEVLSSMTTKIDPSTHPLLVGNESEKSLIIVFSSDRGLAGSLNTNLFKKLSEFDETSQFITLGTKVRSFLAKLGREIVADFPLPESGALETSRLIANFAIDSFLKGEIGRVFVVYTEFFNTLKQEPFTKQLLPILDLVKTEDLNQPQKDLEYKFEPKEEQILDEILPHFVLMELHHYLLEARASEHSARMIAMKNATDNALDLVDDLTLTYNQIRQDSITKEILDISTAALALE